MNQSVAQYGWIAMCFMLSSSNTFAGESKVPDAAGMDMHWGVRIPLRDGVELNAMLYTPRDRSTAAPGRGPADHYVYDPRDLSIADLDARRDPNLLTDQRMIFAVDGKELVYHTAAFDRPLDISGFFRLTAFIAIDQPDTDFQVSVYEIDPDGTSILLSSDQMRARYRESQRHASLVTTTRAQRYEFDHFTFVSRRVPAGSRLRLVIGPIDSIYAQKNYNSGKPVSTQTLADARPVNVRLLHDQAHPSALHIPVGQPE